MKKSSLLIAVLGLFFLLMGSTAVVYGDDIKDHPTCKYCGMDREKFAHSRVLIEYDDGTTTGFCSIHCAAVDLAVNIDKTPKAISVGDYSKKALLNAEKAYWVVGGTEPGVMSGRAKWAFRTQAEASSFLRQSGGVPATFDEAMKATYEDMYTDTKAIRDRRAMKKKAMATEKKPMEHDMKGMEPDHK